MKIVVNTCYGGFGLSEKAEAEFRQKSDLSEDFWLGRLNDYRNDPILVAMVEQDAEATVCSAALLGERLRPRVDDRVSGYGRADDGREHGIREVVV